MNRTTSSPTCAVCCKFESALVGEEVEIAAVHADVECGTFKAMKPDLDMISIGPDLKDVHTPGETLYLNSIPKTWRLLEGVLAEVS